MEGTKKQCNPHEGGFRNPAQVATNHLLHTALCLLLSDVYLTCSGRRDSHPTQNKGHARDPRVTHLRCIGVGRFRRRRDVHRSKDFLAQRVAGRDHRQMLLSAHPRCLLSLSFFCLSLDCTFSSVQFALGSSVSASLFICMASSSPFLTLLWGKWHFLLVLLSAFFCSSARPSSAAATKATEAAGAGEEAATVRRRRSVGV